MEILELLDSKNIDYEMAGQDEVKITCPNQSAHAGGIDSSPSCSINLVKEVCHCLVCGFKLSQLGMTKWLIGGDLDELQMGAISIRSKLKRLQEPVSNLFLEEAEEFEMCPPSTPWVGDYRGISEETFTRVKAKHCKVGWYADRMILPIYQYGRLVGIDSRSLLPKEKMKGPKYLRNKGFDALKFGLYPFDLVREAQPERVVLCEGAFDAINGIDKFGDCFICQYGTGGFNLHKFSQILSIGCTELCLFFDNDKAGDSATNEVANMVKDWIKVTVASKEFCTDGRDLGDLSAEEIKISLDNRSKYK